MWRVWADPGVRAPRVGRSVLGRLRVLGVVALLGLLGLGANLFQIERLHGIADLGDALILGLPWERLADGGVIRVL